MRNFSPLDKIFWLCFIKFDEYLNLYNRNLKYKQLKPAFWYKITQWICLLVLKNYNGYFDVEKQVSNWGIYGFKYTNIIYVLINESDYFLRTVSLSELTLPCTACIMMGILGS